MVVWRNHQGEFFLEKFMLSFEGGQARSMFERASDILVLGTVCCRMVKRGAHGTVEGGRRESGPPGGGLS